MNPYFATYQQAWTLAWHQLRYFNIPLINRVRYGIKSANLAACFLGFSVQRGEQNAQRSAELGCLASIFDLTSDGLKFDEQALAQFSHLVTSTIDCEGAKILLELMDCKRAGSLRFDGLYRGVSALQIIIKHLRAEDAWLRKTN